MSVLQAIVNTALLWQGDTTDFEPTVKKFEALKPLTTATHTSAYDGIPTLLFVGLGQAPCIPGNTRLVRTPVGLQKYNIESMVAAANHFNSVTKTQPGLNVSQLLVEDYPHVAVRRVPAASTAVGDRDANLLM